MNSPTTLDAENDIHLIGDIKPDTFDVTYNNQIGWDVEDDPRDDLGSGDPNDPSDGNKVDAEITIPPVPEAPNGRIPPSSDRSAPLRYRIRASVTIEDTVCQSDYRYIRQDERDQCRQEYIDMNKNRKPDRGEFLNAQTYQNPGHFPFGEINSGHYSWAIFTIAQHLENIRSAIGDQVMDVNSGYRNPIHNASEKGARESRHIYGDAADIAVRDFDRDGDEDRDDWTMLADTAVAEGANYIEPYEDTGTWVHMDWRL